MHFRFMDHFQFFLEIVNTDCLFFQGISGIITFVFLLFSLSLSLSLPLSLSLFPSPLSSFSSSSLSPSFSLLPPPAVPSLLCLLPPPPFPYLLSILPNPPFPSISSSSIGLVDPNVFNYLPLYRLNLIFFIYIFVKQLPYEHILDFLLVAY